MAKLRLGVIGAGSWAVSSHLPNLARRAEDVEFVAVCRRGHDLLDKIRTEFSFAIASEDYHDVIDAGIDLCVVASPPALHHEHTKAALEAGAHVLVEKPVTIDPRQAWDLVETAARVKRHVVVAFGWNYKAMARRAKRLLDEDGGIGQIEHVMIHMSSDCRELLTNTGATVTRPKASLPSRARGPIRRARAAAMPRRSSRTHWG